MKDRFAIRFGLLQQLGRSIASEITYQSRSFIEFFDWQLTIDGVLEIRFCLQVVPISNTLLLIILKPS